MPGCKRGRPLPDAGHKLQVAIDPQVVVDRAETEAPPRGRAKLVALGVGFAPAVLESSWDSALRIEWWPTPIELVLSSESLAIRGRILRADGTPAAGVRISHLESTPYAQAPWATTSRGTTVWAQLDTEALLRGPRLRDIHSDPDGRFELGGLLAKTYRLVAIDLATLELATTAPIPAGTADVEIRFPPVAPDPRATPASADAAPAALPAPTQFDRRLPRIAGRLVDRSGTPVHGATVWLVRALPPGTEGESPLLWHALSSEPATTNLSGEFEFPDVSSAVSELRAVDSEQYLMNRFPLSGSEDLAHLQFTMQRLCNFRIDLRASWMTASSFAVIDADGTELDISDAGDKGVTAGPRQPLYEPGSNPLRVSDNAAAMVFYDAFDSRVLTMPVTLKAGERTLIRP